ncbi:MAG: hypothetical protein MUE33_11200 [Cytophagaceae bacterium]|jgi:hypothetical protein|nr:hypothetical protein [Cytophagaceae bacterium]
MKTILGILLGLLSFTQVTVAQKIDMKAVKALSEKTELFLDSAAKHMLTFIVTKNEAEYDRSMALVNQAKASNVDLEKQIKGIKSKATLASYQSTVKENIDEIAAFETTGIKNTILNDTGKQEHVHFQGKHYDIGKTSKHLFDKFSMYLPAN